MGVTVTLQRDIDEEDEEEMASLGKVVSARYPHAKQEAWWLMVGDTNTNSMLTIKRITVGAASRVKLSFDAPELPGDYKLTLYLCSDSYVGCDQEYDLPLTVVTAD